jgi:hypothetical protein
MGVFMFRLFHDVQNIVLAHDPLQGFLKTYSLSVQYQGTM